MPQLSVKSGQVRKLPAAPGTTFELGIRYDGNQDLDVAIVRITGSEATAVFWGNQDLHRPDLGTTSTGNPWIQTREGDVTHTGDALTGAESATGFDEAGKIVPSRAPVGTSRYVVVVSNWKNPAERDPANPPILADAQNVKFVIRQEGTANEFVIDLGDNHPFDVSVVIAIIEFIPGDPQQRSEAHWAIKNPTDTDVAIYGLQGIGTTDDLITVLQKLGVQFN